MRKFFAAAILSGMLFGMTAYADILPPGQKMVPVCAYFNNTADVLETMAVIGYETAPDGSRVDLSSFIANECFMPSYKFNSYKVYGLTAEHAAGLDYDTYDPSQDSQAFPTNHEIEMGYMYVDEDSTLERVENEYYIVTLETDPGMLIIAAEKTKKYYTGSDEPVITEGEVTLVGASDDGSMDTGTSGHNTGDTVFNDVFSDSPYFEALTYLKENGIVKGYDDGTFKPDSTINRAELMKIIVAAAYDEDAITNCSAFYASQSSFEIKLFTDVVFAMVGGNAPPWYFDYVCVGKHEGFVSGYPDGSFKPGNQINFAEAAKIITKRANMSLVEGDPWYKVYIDVLDNANAIPTTITAFDQKITRGEMAEIIYRLTAKVTDKASMSYGDLK